MERPVFYVGLHQPSDAKLVDRCMISVNRLERRRSCFVVNDWMLDSGAFTRLTSGRGHMPLRDYADHIKRWSRCGNLLTAVTQDWMCEPFVLEQTGLTVEEHQHRTVKGYRALSKLVLTTHVMPVLQGYDPQDYVRHIRMYGNKELLTEGMWVGVGSVCKRNGSPREVEAVLTAIKEVRPDLKLHGFGIKRTALAYQQVSEGFYSTDSMAWSHHARKQGRNANDVQEAIRYANRLKTIPVQIDMLKVLP